MKRHLIKAVENNSIADEIGIEQGDILVSINGQVPKDILEYNLMQTEEYVAYGFQQCAAGGVAQACPRGG